MDLGQNLTEQMQHMYTQFTAKKGTPKFAYLIYTSFAIPTVIFTVKYCRSPELLAASIIYIVLRKNNKPFTLLDLAVCPPHSIRFLLSYTFRLGQDPLQCLCPGKGFLSCTTGKRANTFRWYVTWEMRRNMINTYNRGGPGFIRRESLF